MLFFEGGKTLTENADKKIFYFLGIIFHKLPNKHLVTENEFYNIYFQAVSVNEATQKHFTIKEARFDLEHLDSSKK